MVYVAIREDRNTTFVLLRTANVIIFLYTHSVMSGVNYDHYIEFYVVVLYKWSRLPDILRNVVHVCYCATSCGFRWNVMTV